MFPYMTKQETLTDQTCTIYWQHEKAKEIIES